MLIRFPYGFTIFAKRDPGCGWSLYLSPLATLTYARGWRQWAITITRPNGNWLALCHWGGRTYIDSRKRQRRHIARQYRNF